MAPSCWRSSKCSGANFVMPVVRVLWMLLVLVGAQVVIEGSQR